LKGLALAGLVVVLIGCGGNTASNQPTATPGTMDDAIAELVLHGVAIHNLVSGDSGCPDQDLHDNAVRLEVSIGTLSSTRTIYLMRWRRQADFDATAEAFANCLVEYSARSGVAQRIDQVANAPWRAYGPNWPDQLVTAVTDALESVGSQ
jgi:hypothetical protein